MIRKPKKSTGPRTAKGKSRFRRKPTKHGLFSRELAIAKSEIPEFADLRSGLRAKLKPNTAIKLLVFDDVISCAWRMKLALRYEQISIRKSSEAAAYEPPTQARPSQANGGWTLHKRLKFIKELRDRVIDGDVLSNSPGLKAMIIEAFDNDVGKMLTGGRPRTRRGGRF